MTSVCLIVCFYEGSRDGNQEENIRNYISMHILSLHKLKHNLNQIVFVISKDNIKTPIIDTVKKGDLNITYYYRKNQNLSFGGWVDAIQTFNYDYYILCEDDYIFTKDNFDTILLDNYIKNDCEYLVNWYEANTGLTSTIGIISKNYL